MAQGTTRMYGAGEPWQPNWKPKLAERSNCYGEKRVLQNDTKSSCCPGHHWLAGICTWPDCQSNQSQTCALVGCQGPALNHPFIKWPQNKTADALHSPLIASVEAVEKVVFARIRRVGRKRNLSGCSIYDGLVLGRDQETP